MNNWVNNVKIQLLKNHHHQGVLGKFKDKLFYYEPDEIENCKKLETKLLVKNKGIEES